jgi:hypothetical protein
MEFDPAIVLFGAVILLLAAILIGVEEIERVAQLLEQFPRTSLPK